jgi:hypothetical protein
MKRTLAVLLLVGVAACSSDQDAARQECFTIADCQGSNVCFLGTCVEPGYSIVEVETELTPPVDTPFLPQQTRDPLDLSDGYQDISLSASVTLSGTVGSDGLGSLGSSMV